MKKIITLLLALALLCSSLLTLAGCASILQDSPLSDILGTNPEESKYSQMLLNVLNDSYYNSLHEQLTNENWMNLYNTPAYDPHPYAFLEDEGIDTNKILNGTYPAFTMSFVLDEEPNNLYIHTRVLIDGSYYQSYLITYKLTNKEMSDYQEMHGQTGIDNSFKWPAFFLNDEISKIKQPTQVLETKYSIETFSIFNKTYKNWNYIIPTVDIKAGSFHIILFKSQNNAIALNRINLIHSKILCNNITNDNDIITIHSAASTENNTPIREEFLVNIFNLQDASICNSKDLTID